MQACSPELGAEQVFRCLVEGCARQFCTPAERRQHLIDTHMYSAAFHFDTLHLGSGRARWRRAPEQGCPAAAPWHTDQDLSERTQSRPMAERSRPPAGDGKPDVARGQCWESGKDGPAAGTSMDVDSITQGVSRLSTAGRGGSAGVPDQVSFGRRGRRAFDQRSRGGRSGVL